MLSVITNPNYITNNIEDGFVNADIVTTKVLAYTGLSNVPNNLMLGATSNIEVEAIGGVNVYMGRSNAFTLNTSVVDPSTSVRTDARVMGIHRTAASGPTVVTTPASLSFQPADLSSNVITMGNMSVGQSNGAWQVLTTSLDSFHIAKGVSVAGALAVRDDCVTTGSLFGRDVNVWMDKPTGSALRRVGYGLHINGQDQLEIVKYAKFDNDAEVMRRIAVFGHGQTTSNDASDAGSNYLVFNNFGVSAATSGSGSNASTTLLLSSAGASSAWKASTSSNNSSSIFYGANFGNTSNVGIGYSNPSYKLSVNGEIFAADDVTAFSDARVKDNVETIRGALDKVAALRGCTFTRNDRPDNRRTHMGVIAQEVRAVLPELVSEDKDGYLSVAYGNISAVLIEAIKDIKTRLECLEQRKTLLS